MIQAFKIKQPILGVKKKKLTVSTYQNKCSPRLLFNSSGGNYTSTLADSERLFTL